MRPREEKIGSASRKCGEDGKLVPVGRPSKVGGIIVPVSFWEVSLTRPNFLVLKAEKFAPHSRQKCAKALYLSAFRLYWPALLTYPTLYALHNQKIFIISQSYPFSRRGNY
ncbi:hypothetical protein [Okeania sp. KiyG1]|uniref:hypothetical protein n=1 Tax=Okeania sp. KiyG1 TaxID=2720165 RepID=UPI001921C321|nr:hypothetical protein [Okeania sp. KiyG1]